MPQDIDASHIEMGKATTFFALSDGVYARIFPAVNFRKSMEPVLQACGDHW